MFYSPKDINSLIDILNGDLENTYVISGGTDLIIGLRNKKITDYSIIDITKLSDYKGIREDQENIYIGALTTMTEIAEDSIIDSNLRALKCAAYNLGSEIIRNKATIGGNIANAAQCADTVLALFAFDAEVVLISPRGERTMRIDEVVVGINRTTIKKDEIIAKIIVKKNERISAFQKLGSRKAVTISKISCAVNLLMDQDKVESARVFLGAVGIKPVRAQLLESLFTNVKISEIKLKEFQKTAYDEVELAIPDRSSKYYKRIAIKAVIDDILKDLINYE